MSLPRRESDKNFEFTYLAYPKRAVQQEALVHYIAGACKFMRVIVHPTVTNNLISNSRLVLISLYLLLILSPLTSHISVIDAQTNEAQIADKRNEATEYNNKSLKRNSEPSINSDDFSILSPPSISPNPVGSGGQVNISMNHSDSGIAVESIVVNIQGPNLGSTNPRLTPATIGSTAMRLESGSERDGLWGGNFSFPNYLPDGNYLYTLVITDSKNKVRTIGPFSGIILDRNEPDFPETMIVSAVDGEGKSIANGGITSASNITFTFDGTDNAGVIQLFECNLDNLTIFSEHEHEEDPDQLPSPYSSCFFPMKISAKVLGEHTYVNLGTGNHTFKVRAVDNEYDFDTTPANFSWNILPTVSN
jgi:hypothetical protein